jgi:predicted nucleic acid-binding protein
VSVFVDTSALYALLVATEDGHAAIVAALERILRARRPLLTTNYVLLETAALLQRRFGLAAVRDLEARVVPLLQVRWVDEALHRGAMDRLLRSDRRQLSLVDCASFVVMDAEALDEALALDADFETEGFRVLPGE